jgi:hypothetical protein
MDEREFRAALDKTYAEPSLEALIERFQRAFEASNGDTQTAMVVVNELLEEPLQYEQFLQRMRTDG